MLKKEKKSATKQRERGALKGKKGSIKKLKILTLPPKSSRSGITFYYTVRVNLE